MTAAGTLPPQGLEDEQAVLGALLLVGDQTESVLTETGLLPAHFYRPPHAAVYAAMVALADRTEPVDRLTVTAELRRTGVLAAVGGEAAIDALAAAPPVVGNARQYARQVIEHARWRARLTATFEQQRAVAERDEAAWHAAHTGADGAAAERAKAMDAAAQGVEFEHWLDTPTDVIPTPWAEITEAFNGGVQRGDVTILSGWTNTGKSIAAVNWLDRIAALDGRAGLYLNEMSAVQVTARQLAAHTGIPFRQILRRRLTDQDRQRIRAAYPAALKVHKVAVHGWPWQDIARHLRRQRYDLCCLDLFARLPNIDRTSDVDAAISGLCNAAAQSDTHLIVVHQLNQERAKGAMRPMPKLRDLRSSGAMGNDPANVIFVHRDQREVDVDGQPEPHVRMLATGVIYLDKARNAEVGASTAVSLNETLMRFEPGDAWRGREEVAA